jgi:molybdopterin biosynthesis enzyme
MPEFCNVLTPDSALRALLDHMLTRLETETVPTPQALGRVTAETLIAPLLQPLLALVRSQAVQ